MEINMHEPNKMAWQNEERRKKQEKKVIIYYIYAY